VSPIDPGPVPDLEDLYDERTLAAIDRRPPAPRATAEPPARRRHGLAGALVTGMALALREVYEPPPEGDGVVEFRPDSGDPPDDEWVTFVFVPGAPTASRLIVRPWLSPAGSLTA
jgi:hypothetical protein